MKNGGQGAPLTPIFHNYLIRNIQFNYWPVLILNIGGISNVTSVVKSQNIFLQKDDKDIKIFAGDVAPGNCLIDEWIRKKSKYKYDKDGLIAKSGNINKLILNQAVDNFFIKR